MPTGFGYQNLPLTGADLARMRWKTSCSSVAD